MKKISLSIKITSAFAIVSLISILFFYAVFSALFERHMRQTEKEKVVLIAETIEPLIAMNSYLGLMDESRAMAEQLASRKYVVGGEVVINDESIWSKSYNEKIDHFHIDHPIKDPISTDVIGNITISYSMESFNKATREMQQEVFFYVALMSVLFLTFLLVIRYLLSPLSIIAKRVKAYQLGDSLDFSTIRMEAETASISDAFSLMVDNVREYTVLLEQYKHSVDESSIVSKMNANGEISYVNEEFVRVCGYTEDELIGSSCSLLSDPEIDEVLTKEIWAELQDKKIWKGVLKNKTKSGDDYYVKSTIVPLLDEQKQIVEFISIQHDITQVIQQREQILKQTTDETTGLPNRVKLAQDSESRDAFVFAMFSLDNYDIIKSYYGYEVAFGALKRLADMLNELLEPQRVGVYKLAGGEFGFLAKDSIDLDWFKQICRFTVEKTEGFNVDIDGNEIDLHASVGLTSSRDNYLSYSGLALRSAKESRKAIIYYEDQDNLIEQYENNLKWTKKVKTALSEDRITLFVQPLVDATSMTVTKYECLVRLIDEDGKIISPFFFLDVAKKTNLYHEITHRVISTAFEVFSQVPKKEFAINLSAEDILHSKTVDYLESQIKKYDIGNRVVLEIVESEGIDSFSEVTDFIVKMKGLGCKIAIDDFGTGYSNFSYLMQLKVDLIKVDGSLIKDIDHNPNSQVICSTILNFSSELEMATVAEFVHSEDVLNYVQNLGFDYFQGYHLGEPEPIKNLLN